MPKRKKPCFGGGMVGLQAYSPHMIDWTFDRGRRQWDAATTEPPPWLNTPIADWTLEPAGPIDMFEPPTTIVHAPLPPPGSDPRKEHAAWADQVLDDYKERAAQKAKLKLDLQEALAEAQRVWRKADAKELEGRRIKFGSFNDLAKLRKTGISFSEADFQAIFAPMIASWTSNPKFKSLSLFNNNWTQNIFHTKIMETAKMRGVPGVIRSRKTTFSANAIPGIIRDMSEAVNPDGIMFESVRIDYTEAKGYEIIVYGKRQAVPLDAYIYKCEKALDCATPEQLMEMCDAHEHFVIGGGTILLTQFTECKIGSTVKTYSIATEIQQAPDVQAGERMQEMWFDPANPQSSPGTAPSTGDDWWYVADASVDTVVWRTAAWDRIDRSNALPLGRWELQRGNGSWQPLHTDAAVLASVEEAYLSGRRMLPYAMKYHKPVADNHQYVIDFGEMHQTDIYFPADPRRSNKIRRVGRRS
jgi:hypothetical protein